MYSPLPWNQLTRHPLFLLDWYVGYNSNTELTGGAQSPVHEHLACTHSGVEEGDRGEARAHRVPQMRLPNLGGFQTTPSTSTSTHVVSYVPRALHTESLGAHRRSKKMLRGSSKWSMAALGGGQKAIAVHNAVRRDALKTPSPRKPSRARGGGRVAVAVDGGASMDSMDSTPPAARERDYGNMRVNAALLIALFSSLIARGYDLPLPCPCNLRPDALPASLPSSTRKPLG
jgi:hypothetical protein